MLFHLLLALHLSLPSTSATPVLPRFAGKESNAAAVTLTLSDQTTVLHAADHVSFDDKTVVSTLSSLPSGKTLQVTLIPSSPSDGCLPFQQSPPTSKTNDQVKWALVVRRGNCTFATKLQHAQTAGAAALVVLNTPASLATADGVLLDMCSVYAHRNNDGKIICDSDKVCQSVGLLDFKFSNKDTTSAECCIDVERALGTFRNLGSTLNQTIPFLFLSVPDARVLEQALRAAVQLPVPLPVLVTIQHRGGGIDGSALCTWGIGVFAVILSCYCAAAKERREAYTKFWLPLSDRMMHNNASALDGEDEEEQELVEVLTWKHAVAMLCCSGITLLGLYGLIKAGFAAMVLVMQFFFGYAVVIATYKLIFYPLLKKHLPTLHEKSKTWHMCGETQTCRATVPAAIALSVSVALLWGLTRHAAWNWVLLDCLGLCVCCLIVQTMKIAGLRAATVLLLLFFLYDIFMVFITPSIFGDSVMVEVATGGGANLPSTTVQNTSTAAGGSGSGASVFPSEECVRTPGEMIPMLYMFPRFSGWPSGYSMLGYGDIIFPSILLSHVLRFDYEVRGRLCCWSYQAMEVGNESGQAREGTTYFPWLVVGYAVGLLLAFLANYFQITINGVHGQPALLYLVPCTLGVHIAMSKWKGEFEEQWKSVKTAGDASYVESGNMEGALQDGGQERAGSTSERDVGGSDGEDEEENANENDKTSLLG